MVAAPDSAATACSHCTRTGECERHLPAPLSTAGRCLTRGDQPLKKSLPLLLASLVHQSAHPATSSVVHARGGSAYWAALA